MNNDAIFAQEDYFLGLLVEHPEMLPYINGMVSGDMFVQDDAPNLYQLVEHAYVTHNSIVPECIPDHLQVAYQRAMAAVASRPVLGDLGKALESALSDLYDMRLVQKQHDLSEQLAKLSPSEKAYRQVLQQLSCVQQQLRTMKIARELSEKHEHTQD